MKLKIAIMSLLTSILMSAASIDYLSNNSASYFQNPSQTGKISVEGVFYNPAGTAFLEDGTYLNMNMQNSLIEESMTLKGKNINLATMPEHLHSIFYTKKITFHYLEMQV